MTVDELKELLKQKELFVSFYKKDGSYRRMFCTLKPDVIPHIEGTSAPGPEHLITVFDLDKQGWRNINLSKGFNVEGY